MIFKRVFEMETQNEWISHEGRRENKNRNVDRRGSMGSGPPEINLTVGAIPPGKSIFLVLY